MSASRSWSAVAALLVFLGSASSLTAQPVSYQRQVKPILERNCMACHACYDAPCQLKFTSPEGLERGATKAPVYLAARRKDAPPTRLFVDASTTEEWRQKGFSSVTEGGMDSLMGKMLQLGRSHMVQPDQPISESIKTGLDRENSCPEISEFEEYAGKKPEEGMPLGVTPLQDEEYTTLQRWLEQGAPIDAEPLRPTSEEALHIRTWETFLNQEGMRERLVARYIYEHLFLAHLYLEDGTNRRFFELVRSRTAPGTPIEVVATDRPNHDPGGPFFYRLRPVQGTIVHKTHITYPLTPRKLARYKELFLSRPWEIEALPEYDEHAAVNPFETFAAIPAESRYRFLLDNALFFVRNFIRGPVCRGQVATDVIDDHFHALFQHPDADIFLHDRRYAARQVANLHMPGEKEKKGFRFGVTPRWMKDEQKYTRYRNKAYEKRGEGAGWDYLWRGYGENPDALQTVFRHHDSTTVVRGLVGEKAKTVWVMDYPILERIYYLLVVNFNVFGRLTHQLQTRLYFDLLRAESEANFLRLLPKAKREGMRNSWYRGTVASLKRRMVYEKLDDATETKIDFQGGDPRPQFVAGLLKQVTRKVAGPVDYLNRCEGGCANPRAGAAQQKVEAALQRLLHRPAAKAPFISQLPEVTFLRIEAAGGEPDLAYTLIRNRAHRNVAFMMQEEGRYEPEKDTVTLVAGPLGSYPNFIFRVCAEEVDDFVDGLLATEDEEAFTKVVDTWGVRRTHPEVWDHFHFFREWMMQNDLVEAGLHDFNRYENF